MKEINLPPFYVGQRVLRIGDTVFGVCKKGEIYTVNKCIQCPHCNDWKVNCIEFPILNERFIINPCSCGGDFYDFGLLLGRAVLFSAINENFRSIEYSEVLEKEKQLISVN